MENIARITTNHLHILYNGNTAYVTDNIVKGVSNRFNLLNEKFLMGLVLSVEYEGAQFIGLRNTDLRLKRIYGQRLQIKSTPNEGTTITFNIPK